MVAENKEQKTTKKKQSVEGKDKPSTEEKKSVKSLKSRFDMRAKENHKMTVGALLGWAFLMALWVGVVLIAALYFMVVDPSTILNMQRDFEDTWSSVETFTTPFLQTALIIVLYCTHHRGLLMLFLAVEAVYFCIRNLYKRGHIG